MKLVFTCGGTGGHIYPALAVAKTIRERYPDTEFLFIGSDGLEKDLVPREGFRLEQLTISGFQRKFTPRGLWENAKTVVNIAGAIRRARQILKDFRPDCIIGTGGYASYPALHEGARLGIPTVVHESNAVPGLTTRLVAERVDKILVAFESCRNHYKHPEKVCVTGTPCREEFLYQEKAAARSALQLDARPVVVSCWGSLGAREMNKKIADFMVLASREDTFQHVHATGSYGWRWMPEHVRSCGLNPEEHPNIRMQEYIYDMPAHMAAADLFISRAGAATISEITISGTPAIIVPSPNVAENHQEKNARVLEEAGAAVVIRENECTGKLLYETAKKLLADPEKLRSMRENLVRLAVVDSTQRICDVIRDLAKAP